MTRTEMSSNFFVCKITRNVGTLVGTTWRLMELREESFIHV